MKYMTRDFGEIEVEDDAILTFVQPLFGFEDKTKYTLIYDEDIGEQMVWLQSLEDEYLCFILFDPSPFTPFFNPRLPFDIDKTLGKGQYICWVVLAIQDDISKATVNLKSPIFINESTRLGAQIILERDYPVKYPIMREER